MLSRQLLIIDDDECFVKVWGHILTNEGFSVTAVPRVMEAKAYLRDYTPDVIFCDVELPELDTFAFCNFLRASPRTHKIPLVLFGTLGDESKQKLAQTCKIHGYLEKPFGRKELIMLLHRVLNPDSKNQN